MFPVFKPKTPFYCENENIYAYIGTKEGVNSKSKYEVLETKKTKSGIEYDKVGEVKPSQIWDNTGIYMAQENLEQQYKGTQFVRASGQKDICDQGLLLREMGKLGYQYKKHHRIFLAGYVGQNNMSESKLEKMVDKYGNNKRNFKADGTTFGLESGWLINSHTNFAWNPLNAGLEFGSLSYIRAYATTGVILRTDPLGKHGKFALFVWPTIGAQFGSMDVEYTYDDSSLQKYASGKYSNGMLNL